MISNYEVRIERKENEILFLTHFGEGKLIKVDGWTEYGFKAFLDNIQFDKKMDIDVPAAKIIIKNKFKNNDILYHEWMLKILKNELILDDSETKDILKGAYIIHPITEFMYNHFLRELEIDIRKLIQGAWEFTQSENFRGMIHDCEIIVDYSRMHGGYYYYVLKRSQKIKEPINSLNFGGVYRFEEEAMVHAEQHISKICED